MDIYVDRGAHKKCTNWVHIIFLYIFYSTLFSFLVNFALTKVLLFLVDDSSSEKTRKSINGSKNEK